MKRQLAIYLKNLNRLEIQKAYHGLDVPTHLSNEIEYTREQIRRLIRELQRKEGILPELEALFQGDWKPALHPSQPVISFSGNRNEITVRYIKSSGGAKNMGDLKEQFGKRLRALRMREQMTQEQLAEAAGISVDFLSLIERGRNAPSFTNIERLAKALRVPVKELFNFDEE